MRRASLGIALLALLSCGGEAPPASVDREGLPEASVEEEPQGLTDPARQGGRSLRRMNIDQLQASLLALTGEGWTEDVDGVEVDLFESLSGSLGKPDFLDATEEDLVPGLLFQKFLDDAANAACASLTEREASGGERRLRVSAELSDPPDSDPVRADLARALLLFHGRAVSPTDDEALGPWIWLLGEASAASDAQGGWRAVCVGLVSHPDFYSY